MLVKVYLYAIECQLMRNRIIAIALSVASFTAHAQQDMHELKGDKMSLKFLVREPNAKDKKTPLIILLHGRGGTEESMFSKADQLPKEAIIISPRAPLDMAKGTYGWYHVVQGGDAPEPEPAEAESSRKILAAFIKEIEEKYQVPPNHVYIMGFSQGGAMALGIGLTQPELVRGVISLSGRVLNEFKTHLAPTDRLKPLVTFIGHGTKDKLLPLKYAQMNKTFLEGYHIPVAYHEYDEGHEINAAEMLDIKDWFKKELQRK